METPKMIPLDEADIASLRNFATVHLGLEVAAGTNGPQLRGKILKADPNVTDIPAFIPEGAGVPRAAPPAKPVVAGAVRPAITANGEPVDMEPDASPAGWASGVGDPMHHSHDPKITISIARTDDKRRTKDVTVQVNGVTFQIMREKEVPVPYRVYLALKDAMEDAAVDGDEINPVTLEPIKVWAKVPSYPFSVIEKPPQAEIDAWMERTARDFQNVPA